MKFHISNKHDDLDMRWVINAISTSYWGDWLTPMQIMRACDNSLCIGAYTSPDEMKQIGLCRIVTDHATFSTITDMIVQYEHRRQGVGSAMLAEALAHPWVSKTACILQTRNATDFYERFGFRTVAGNVMMKSPQ